MEWEVGGGNQEGGYICILMADHVGIRQKPAQYFKAIIFQLKFFFNVKKESENKKPEKYKDGLEILKTLMYKPVEGADSLK